MKKNPRLKIALVYGTRPEIIKLSPLMRLFERLRVPYFQIHSGQHYSPQMDRVFFDELKLPRPTHTLKIKSRGNRQGDHVARMVQRIEDVFYTEKPTHLFVQGDTNTVLAGALAAAKASTTHRTSGLRIKVCHVEAGLRSYDRDMPEEINRVLTDHVSDYLFVPTPESRRNALKEGIPPQKIFVTGNTVVDAVRQNVVIARKTPAASRHVTEPHGRYILVTLHRQENVDDRARLEGILSGIDRASRALGWKVIFPAHPRTRSKIEAFKIRVPDTIRIIEPVGYLPFLALQVHAGIILSDSGGIQEEACILKVPCVTLRTTTERPETITVGANLLAGVQAADILKASLAMVKRKRTWRNPYGDGHASEAMLRIVREGQKK